MNVDADSLATVELKEYGSILPMVPFDPASQVLLHINGRTITGDIPSAIQNCLFAAYFCNRFGWSPSTHDNVNWEAFSQVYSNYPRSRKFFNQFGWKKLPVGQRLHSREAWFDDRCPSCLFHGESDDHVFQCPHADHRQWRVAFLSGIHDKLPHFLDPELLDMIHLGTSGTPGLSLVQP